MADILYTGETVTTYFELWDGEVSPTKPTARPDDAWITDPSEITLTIKKPDGTDEEFTLTGDEVEPTDRDGEYRARFETDGGAGTYVAVWEAETADGYMAVSTAKTKAKARP